MSWAARVRERLAGRPVGSEVPQRAWSEPPVETSVWPTAMLAVGTPAVRLRPRRPMVERWIDHLWPGNRSGWLATGIVMFFGPEGRDCLTFSSCEVSLRRGGALRGAQVRYPRSSEPGEVGGTPAATIDTLTFATTPHAAEVE